MKIPFKKAEGDNTFEAPMTQEQLDNMVDCPAHSITLPNDPHVLLDITDPNVVKPPSKPEDGDSYWRQVLDAVRFVHLAKNNTIIGGRGTNDWSQLSSLNVGEDFVPEVFKIEYGQSKGWAN